MHAAKPQKSHYKTIEVQGHSGLLYLWDSRKATYSECPNIERAIKIICGRGKLAPEYRYRLASPEGDILFDQPLAKKAAHSAKIGSMKAEGGVAEQFAVVFRPNAKEEAAFVQAMLGQNDSARKPGEKLKWATRNALKVLQTSVSLLLKTNILGNGQEGGSRSNAA